MFALNPALHCIEESESDVLEIFQSAPLSMALHRSKQPEQHTAYVCAVKKKSKVRVYVALTTRFGQVAVYTRTGAAESLKNCDDSLEAGLAFARSLGFVLEPVNLEYSPTLREVVLKAFKIFNQPRPVAGPRRVKDVSFVPPRERPQISPPAPPASVSAAPAAVAPAIASVAAASVASVVEAGVAAVAESVASVAAPSAVLTEAKQRSGHEASMAKVLTALRQEMEELGAERDALSAQVEELSALHLTVTATLKTAKKENAKLLAERDRLAHSAAAHEQASSELATLRKEMTLLSRQRDEADRRNKELVEEARSRSEQEKAAASAVSDLRKEVEAVGAERDALSVLVQELSALQLTATAALKNAKKDVARLTAERDKLARSASDLADASSEMAATAKVVSDLRREVEAMGREKDALSAQVQELSALQQSSASALQSAQVENANLAAEREKLAQSACDLDGATSELAALREEVALLSRQRDEADSRARELLEENAALAESAGRAQEEAARLAMERDLSLSRATESAGEKESAASAPDDLRETLTSLSKERADALARVKKLEKEQSAKDAELEAMRADLSAVRAERETLLQSGSEQSQGVERLKAELAVSEQRLQQAELDLQSERNSLNAALSAVTPPKPEAAPGAGSQDRYHEYMDAAEAAERAITMPSLVMPEVADFPAADNCFATFSEGGDAGSVLFFLHPGQTRIEYASPEDVVEVQRSTNVASIAADGKNAERCEGYICRLKEGTASRVFIALLGKQSGKTTVYHPEVQPADERAVAATFLGALSFAEQVGLMMEPLKFHSSEQRTDFIANCPVLSRRSIIPGGAQRQGANQTSMARSSI